MSYHQPLSWDACDGDLTIDGVAMRGPAWGIVDLTDLWVLATMRGSSRIIPGATGVIANPKRRTITRVDLPFVVIAHYDRLGAYQADAGIGLQTNLDYLNTNVITPPTLPDRTRTATLDMPTGANRTAEIQVVGFEPRQKSGADRLFSLTLEIPAGRFV